MKLVFVISSLSCGGAERAMADLTQSLLGRGHEIHVLTGRTEEEDFYQLDKKIRRKVLGFKRPAKTVFHAVWNNLKRAVVLRREIGGINPDVVVSYMDSTNVLTLFSLLGTFYPVVVSEHFNPKKRQGSMWWGVLRRLMYPFCRKLVSVSRGVDDCFYWLNNKKRVVINNPLTKLVENNTGRRPRKKTSLGDQYIVSVGRLTRQKRYDLLITAFKTIAFKYPDLNLVIVGSGELQLELENLSKELGLTGRIIFTGEVSNPYPLIESSKLFVLSSEAEGFGIVLIEAMVCGIPIISTDCPFGPSEIIDDGVNGILVPNRDVDALALAVDRLMRDEGERIRMGLRGREMAEKYRLDKITDRWEMVLNEACWLRGRDGKTKI